MLAIAASRLSSSMPSSDTWRRQDDDTKKRSMLGSWRDRRDSKETGEEKAVGETKVCGETKEKIENWRSRKQEKSKTVDETGVYGESMPSEWKLQKLYKQLKIDNNNFITWLVESVYPFTEGLPSYITLSRKQAKDHPKYEIIVNNFPQLARQINKVSPTTLALLDRVITERTEYSYWMSRKSTDQLSQVSHDTHTYYIEVLKEVQTILAARIEPETTTTTSPSPRPAEATDISTETHNTTLGKRKNSATNTQGLGQRKTAKTANSTPKPKQNTTEARQQQQAEWREAVANSCDNIADKTCAPLPKPISYAAACRVTIVA